MFSVVIAVWMLVWRSTAGNTGMAFLWVIGIIAVIILGVLGRQAFLHQKKNPSPQTRPITRSTQRNKREGNLDTHIKVYFEVIESEIPNDIGKTLVVTESNALIGRGEKSSLILQDRTLDKEHCRVFYHSHERRYYLENCSKKRTVFYNEPLAPNEIRPLQNGDLIALGDSVVLQFRIKEN
jgi:hypothetical protein